MQSEMKDFKGVKSLLSFFVVTLFFVAGQGLLSANGYAADDDKDERKFADVKTKQRQAVGKACAKRLEKVQEVLAADTDPTKEQLSGLARQLPTFTQKDCATSYEKSNVYNTLGYIYYSLENYDQSIRSYIRMINEPDADEKQRLSTRYTVAQLYMIKEDYGNAVKQLEAWMKEATIIGASAKVLLAQAYYQVNRKNDALKLVNEVVADAETKGELPKEGWWSLQRVLYYEKDDYRKVVDILKKLVTHYPKLSYWKQLGGMYSQLEKDIEQLVATEVVYLQKGLTKERQLLSLAYMYLGADVPFRAALLMEEGMKQGIIEQSGKNLEVLGGAWQQAQSFSKASQVLERSAKLSGKGEIYARLASVYIDQDKNVEAARAAQNAIRKGGLKRADLTHLTLGSARINLHCYRDAIKSFREAAKSKKIKKTANQWIAYAQSEGERRGKLVEQGAKIATCRKV